MFPIGAALNVVGSVVGGIFQLSAAKVQERIAKLQASDNAKALEEKGRGDKIAFLAAAGKNDTTILIGSFIGLILLVMVIITVRKKSA